MNITIVLLILFSYLVGSIPTGYLIAKHVMHIDIREHGSGNPGAANVYRIVGKWAGVSTFLIDAIKGFVPVCLARVFCPDIYVRDFHGVCEEFLRIGNPLLIPETSAHSYAGPRLAYCVGHYHAWGFAPFGFEKIGGVFWRPWMAKRQARSLIIH